MVYGKLDGLLTKYVHDGSWNIQLRILPFLSLASLLTQLYWELQPYSLFCCLLCGHNPLHKMDKKPYSLRKVHFYLRE